MKRLKSFASMFFVIVMLFTVAPTAFAVDWQYANPPEGTYYIVPEADTNYALDLRCGGDETYTPFQLYERNNTDAQVYYLQSIGGGWYLIKHAHSGKVLNVQNGEARDDARLWLYPYDNTYACHWRFFYVPETGTYILQNRLEPGYVLDLHNAQAYNEATVHLWSAHTGLSARWYLVPVNGSNNSSPSSQASSDCYPAYHGSSNSIAMALRELGVDSSYNNRSSIAAANGIGNYRGTASQNTQMLNLLRQGALRKAGQSAPSNNTNPSGNIVSSNLSKINFQKQGPINCKSTSLAMALNLLTGSNRYNSSMLGGNSCTNIQGRSYTGSDGATYTATYKRDNYVGSYSEEVNAIENAIANGLPIVAAVHSTRKSGNKHWIVVIGKQNNDYLVVDPVTGSGSMSDSVRTMSQRGYALGSSQGGMHYGYISFNRR